MMKHNVVPETAQAGIDIRIAPTVDLHAFQKQIEEWCAEDGYAFAFKP